MGDLKKKSKKNEDKVESYNGSRYWYDKKSVNKIYGVRIAYVLKREQYSVIWKDINFYRSFHEKKKGTVWSCSEDRKFKEIQK